MLRPRRRPAPGSTNPRRTFSADLANDLSDCAQNLIRQLGVRLSHRARNGHPTDDRRHDRQGTQQSRGNTLNRRMDASVLLVKALGGGWRIEALAQAQSSARATAALEGLEGAVRPPPTP
jgi:hypothetical protein